MYFKRIDRETDNPDPYARRDSQSLPLTIEVIKKIIENRMQMLHYEYQMVTSRYLEEGVLKGINMLEVQEQLEYRVRLEELLKEKKMSIKKDLTNPVQSLIQESSQMTD